MLRKKYIKSSSDIRKIPYDLVSELVILRDYADTGEAYLNEEHKLLVDLADGLYNNGWIDEIVSKMKSTYPDIFDKYGDDYFELILDDCRAIDSQIRPNNVQDLIDEYLAKAEEFSGSVDIESATDVCAADYGNTYVESYWKIMNLLDSMILNNQPLTTRDLYKLQDMASAEGHTIEDIADANDCGECHTWQDLYNALKALHKSGERVSVHGLDMESATDVCSAITYELSPTDGRKSFYGKAKVLLEDDGTETLYSYGTPIIRRKPNGDLDPLWDGYSATTGRHIASFAGLNKKQYMDLLKKKQGVESAEKIECVGHNDPGRYYDLVDYYDVWEDEDGGWQVNDVSIIERDIWISDDTTEEELFNFLKDTIGYFDRNTKFSDVEIQWYEPEFVEIFDASNGYPLCSLRESYKK